MLSLNSSLMVKKLSKQNSLKKFLAVGCGYTHITTLNDLKISNIQFVLIVYNFVLFMKLENTYNIHIIYKREKML